MIKMVELYGRRTDRIYGYGKLVGRQLKIRELVATFENEELAFDYVNKSQLNAADSEQFMPDLASGKYVFKKGSLLRKYTSFEITTPENAYVPHNPSIE